MPLVTTTEILLDAQKNHYAVAAFNFENMEMAQAVVQAADSHGAPVLLQTTLSTLRYSSMPLMVAMAGALAQQVRVPVALHLDHGTDYNALMQALRAGYTSVMIDGSHHSLEQNIAITRRVVEAAQPMGVPVEAELGKVGGKEDDVEAGGSDPGYTDPQDACRFVEQTGVNSLAVGIGTAHGFYKGTPKLAMDVLEAIGQQVQIPLVLHGASGIADQDVRRCIALGICKVNFATELRAAYTQGIRQLLAQQPDAFDPKAYGAVGREEVRRVASQKIALCCGR